MADPKRRIVVDDFGVVKTFQRAAEFVTVLDENKEKLARKFWRLCGRNRKNTPQYLEFINNEVEISVVLEQVFDTEPHLRTKWINSIVAKLYERNDDVTVQDIADRFWNQ